jgi:Na+/proline symporter
MSGLDWVVMLGTLVFISAYGVWKTRGVKTANDYLRGSDLRWPTIGLSIMATQASAITFLSTPGQAYEDGLRFVQFYFGLPLAMVLICIFFVPIYYKLNVYTAYEYLEQRFDVRVRVLAAALFLIGRGLAAGITIYAPAIILSALLGWSLNLMCLLIGIFVVAYTVTGGSRAVSQTNKQQMVVILLGILIAAVVIVTRLPDGVDLGTAATLAGALGRMNPVDFGFNLDNRYNFWSGITGGLFLSLSYFGTDQSQVQRYLGGRSVAESRLGLLFNGMLKIPMQLLILCIGVLVFVFYLFEKPPVFFNEGTLAAAHRTTQGPALKEVEARWDTAFEARKTHAQALATATQADDSQGESAARAGIQAAQVELDTLRKEAKTLIKRAVPEAELKDSDYIFVSFVLKYLPAGLIGLLLAVILAAAMSSTASELNALGSTTVVDIYRRLFQPGASDAHVLRASKLFTVMWGGIAVAFATFAALLDNLIQAVNILGSIFYGVILGLFLVAFFFKRVRGTPTLIAALIAEAGVVTLFFVSDIGFLWFNVIGCAGVVGLSLVLQRLIPNPAEENA